MKLIAITGIVAIASLLSAATIDAQSKPRPRTPAKTRPRAEPPSAPAPPKPLTIDPGSVQVTGEVVSPGKISLQGPAMAVIEALGLTGGLTGNAGDEVIVSRRPLADAEPQLVVISRQDLERGRAEVNLMLQDGDIVNVPTVKRYFITGGVKNPGSYALHYGTTVARAIVLAGGLTSEGSDKGITIVRPPNPQTLRAVTVDAGADDKVQPNDEIKIKSRL